MKNILITPIILILCGCAMVPATKISFNPRTGELNVRSPKDVELTGLHAYATNGVSAIDIQKYSSKNNIEVIKAVTQANAETQKKGAELIGTIIDSAK